MSKNIIVLEFNELTPHLVERFMAQGHLPNFSRLRGESIVTLTDAEEKYPALEPWIQWVTVHTGLRYAEHKVFDLNDGPKFRWPRIWDIVSESGRPVWICGSMNAAVHSEKINGLVLPDPWATGVAAHPPGLFEPYLQLVRTYVQEYTRDKPGVSLGAIVRFLSFMARNGLSWKTVSDTLRQLANELRRSCKWRRAVILDRFQWDVFRRFYRQTSPALATFFLNSTAHYQHYFWRNMDPGPFQNRPSEAAQRTYGEAILFGYRKMDEIIGECLSLAGPETSIVMCTALSQQPMLTYEDIGGKQLFKPRSQADLFAFAGITQAYEYAPVMAEQFHLTFQTVAEAEEAERKIKSLRLDDGREVMMVRRDDRRLFSGCNLIQAPPPGTRVTSGANKGAKTFDELFYPVEAVRSGMHHPDGMLWIRTPERKHQELTRKVSLLEIAPTLLALADVDGAHRFARPPLPELPSAVALRTAA